ncbi:MAG: hypothetical protein MSA89_09250 [Clostridium sp.]|nr:hypothetical protein [Clostridium sp.]MCI7443249.1 hypothetical protein [Clostridium sp.]
MGYQSQERKNQEYKNDVQFFKILIDNIATLESIFNKEEMSLEEKIKINWNKYIKDDNYQIDNIQKVLKSSIIESSNIKEYEFISKEDIFSINIREQYVLLVYLKLMVMIWEKSECTRISEGKEYLNSILDELNCKAYLKLNDIDFLSKNIGIIYNRKQKAQMLKNIYFNRIPMIKDKIKEITINIENKISSQENKEYKVEKEEGKDIVNEKNVFEITENILKLVNTLKNKLKEEEKQNLEGLSSTINKKTEEDYDLLKQKYDILKFEKEQLLEKKNKLEEENQKLANDLFKLGQEKKRGEETAYSNAVSEFFKCINGPEDLFLDKVYSYVNGYEELKDEDIKRLFNNFISNIGNFGVIKSPESDLNEIIKVNEESIEKYRCSKSLAEEIIDKKEVEVKIKYPVWMFINKKSKGTKNILFNAMIDKEE